VLEVLYAARVRVHLRFPWAAQEDWFCDWLCDVGELAPSGSSNIREAAREVDDGGDARHCQNPRAIHAERGAASTHARGARLDCVVNALAPFIPQKRYVHGDQEDDRDGPRPPSR
jgi:hypothetical protein